MAQGTRKKAVFKILVPNPAFSKPDVQKERPWWNHSVALWAEMHWLWPFCHHSLNNTHPDNKEASMPQLFSSKPTVLQVQSTALSSQYSLLFPLQKGFAPAPYKRYKETLHVYSACVVPTNTAYQISENVQVQMKSYRCYHIFLPPVYTNQHACHFPFLWHNRSKKEDVWNMLMNTLVNNATFTIPYLKRKQYSDSINADFPRY